MAYLRGRVLPLPIGDWVQGCVSRLQSGSACLAEHLGQQGGGSGEESTEKASGTAHACQGALTQKKKKREKKKKKKRRHKKRKR